VSDRFVHAQRVGAVDTLVLDSQHNRNALSIQLLEELLDGVARSADGDGRLLVLDHRGSVFCAGVDLRERQALGAGGPSHAALLARLLRQLWAYPKPVLCRIAGRVRGGGMGVVGCSDIVVATPAADFAFSEVRVGVAPAIVSAVALQKVALGSLLPWLLTGEPFDAETARQMGLVTAVSEDGALDGYTASLLRGGPNALVTTKRVARNVAASALHETLVELESFSTGAFADEEAREGMAAFSERRAPSWSTSWRS
jgi:methylglutaconyl-CoA hydratase